MVAHTCHIDVEFVQTHSHLIAVEDIGESRWGKGVPREQDNRSWELGFDLANVGFEIDDACFTVFVRLDVIDVVEVNEG